MSSIKLTADSGGGTFEIKAPSSSGNTRVLTLPDTGNITLGRGKLLQVVQATKTDPASATVVSGGTWVPTTPKCSITPSNASNKILVQATINLSVNQDNHGMHLTVLKAGALMFVGDADGGFLHFNYLDTAGGTSAIEYSLQLSHDSGSTQTMYLNRTVSNDNSDDRPLGASSIILSEIAA
mgnify:CR=1 FL=1